MPTVGSSSYAPLETSVPGADGPDDERLRLSDVGKLARRSKRRVVRAARADDKVTFRKLLTDHLGAEQAAVEVVTESWPTYDHVNVQAGLDAWLAEPGREHRLVGVIGYQFNQFGLAELMRGQSPHLHGVAPGSVARVNLPSGPAGEVRSCVRCALYLVEYDGHRIALLFRIGERHTGHDNSTLEIGGADSEVAGAIAAELRELAVRHNVYRKQVVSFGHDMFGDRETVLAFHERPTMSERDLILPPETLAAVSRQVVGVARQRTRLLAAGQHLKRGLLLYGPPGVGKTHTVRYLTSQLSDTTIVLLSGNSLHMVGSACSVARTLQPAMIVIEDVDLIAEDRSMRPGENPMLFQLLNEMDGLAEDADVVFLLTTNRADMLEPALAQRPGRVDQAVELQLPDADARARLFALYRGALDLDESRLDDIIARTKGVTASFVKELLRRAAVRAAERLDDPSAGLVDAPASADPAAPLRVWADDLDAALADLLDTRNAMTRVLLGDTTAPRSARNGLAGNDFGDDPYDE